MKNSKSLPRIQPARQLFGYCLNCTLSLEWASVWRRWPCSVLAAGGLYINRFGSTEYSCGGAGPYTNRSSNHYSARPRKVNAKHNKLSIRLVVVVDTNDVCQQRIVITSSLFRLV